ncbi:hypothetical protein EI42_03413 [Thermosporothrix hazakensis]|jgi:hypothetical protein|uniref:Uncharacterized protein n=2 Tax=Thermosporothrix TaxID=768650 RepID=A0A326UE36_THEHA|nr:hypothetical protein [Thermosporothrix hazakensis]PZW28035.1 hypothetical protein EI42_03413 [Thermosporothrix hazakensis]BBH86965.1 hypothetical protein KTC_17160 [Thermosporothrix sp. COM3]GCE51256.1 hypothetical protein KTH_61250 [Thermosporothrix hazakensis]
MKIYPPSYPPRLFWVFGSLFVVIMAELCLVLAHLLVFPVLLENMFFPVIVVLAALIAWAPMWWAGMVRSAHRTIWEGLLFGVLISFLAYRILFLIVVISVLPSAIGKHFIDEMVFMALIMCTGILWTGWITLPLGGLAGILLTLLQKWLMREPIWQSRGKEKR